MKVPEWNSIVWYVVLVLAVIMELLGVFDGKFNTLTYLLRKWIPLWGRAMILGWLIWHFLISPDNWINLVRKALVK